MKHHFLIALLCLLTFSNCSLNDNDNIDNDAVIITSWHLISTRGGLAGVDDSFSLNTVVWNFNDENKSLVVTNNNADDSKQDLLDSGTYTFTITTVGDDSFLVIDNNELGEVTIEQTRFTIDQNNTSLGPAADGFIYTFQKTTEVQ